MDTIITLLHSTKTTGSVPLTSHPILPTEIIQGYGKWIQGYIDHGWDAYLFTIMFRHISGSKERKIHQMHQAISRMYQKLVTRVVRKPRSETKVNFLPKGIFFPDVPAYKKSQYRIGEVSVNDGIHVHGIVLAPKESRLKGPLHLHFARKSKLYVRGKILRVQVDLIRSNAEFATDYAGKALKRGRFSNDEILVFPRTVSELPAKNCCPAESKEQREIKDIQAATNVSDEVAGQLLKYQSKR